MPVLVGIASSCNDIPTPESPVPSSNDGALTLTSRIGRTFEQGPHMIEIDVDDGQKAATATLLVTVESAFCRQLRLTSPVLRCYHDRVKNDEEQAREKRARARASWPGSVLRLSEQPDVEIVEGMPSERIGMVRELTLAAWAMSGRPMPRYDRATMPGRVIRRGDCDEG